MIRYMCQTFRINAESFDRAEEWYGITKLSLFTKYYNRIMTTRSNQFIVINMFAMSPHIYRKNGGSLNYSGAVQVRINTTEFFMYPDGSRSNGISNEISPWPGKPFDEEDLGINILPGHNWDVILNMTETPEKYNKKDYMYVYLRYILYEDEDAVIANKLLMLNTPVTPENVCEYRISHPETELDKEDKKKMA